MDDNLLPDQPARIIVAMSGGVDSSTAAALLVEAGHQVSGLMARLWRDPQVEADVQGAEKSARQVCAHLGIPFQALDLREHFRAQVVNYFAAEYAQGRTPNPCLACNRQIKFGALLRWARANGADYLATGHYARRRQVKGRYQLLRGADPSKDQSYVLYALDQRTLAQVLFPLGSYDKEYVRQMARARGLAAAERDESQEICFIPDNDYRRFMQAHYPKAIRPGAIYDTLGQRIGTHQGLAFYTIGQRKDWASRQRNRSM